MRTKHDTDEDSRPTIVGHRGCAAENPENTVAAVGAAAGTVDAIEIDVRRCGTGELVAIHDSTLDRLTGEQGRVDETSLETLADLDVLESGEPIPPLVAIFEAAPSTLTIVFDLKEPGLVEDLLSLLPGFDHDVLFSSIHPGIIAEVRDRDPSIPTAVVVREPVHLRAVRPLALALPNWAYGPVNVAGMIERARTLGCDAIHPRYELCLRTDLVTLAHSAGVRVAPWTVTTNREYASLRETGVDAVITDVCAGLLESPRQVDDPTE